MANADDALRQQAENALYRQVGEIHANVETLMAREKANADRIRTLEHRTYGFGALFAAILTLKDPGTWMQWLQLLK